MSPVVTIGLPFHNDEATLAAAIRSVERQTFADWELLLVDDGSTDASATIAQAATSDTRIRLVADGVNCGLPARLNQIASLARGEFLARMDADDLMHPDRIGRQVAVLRAQPDLDVVGTATFLLDPDLAIVGRSRVRDAAKVSSNLRYPVFSHPTVTGRTDWFRTHRYDEDLLRAQDLDLWNRAAPESRYAVLDEPLLFYRRHSTADLGGKDRASVAAHIAVLRRYGVPRIGRLRTEYFVWHVRATTAAGRLLGVVRADHLSVRRFRAVPPADLAAAQAIVDELARPDRSDTTNEGPS